MKCTLNRHLLFGGDLLQAPFYILLKTFTTESFSEKKKGFIELYASRKRTSSWGVQSKPPGAGLNGDDEHVHRPGVDGALLSMSLGKKDVGFLERIYISYRRGRVGEKVKHRKLWDRSSIR